MSRRDATMEEWRRASAAADRRNARALARLLVEPEPEGANYDAARLAGRADAERSYRAMTSAGMYPTGRETVRLEFAADGLERAAPGLLTRHPARARPRLLRAFERARLRRWAQIAAAQRASGDAALAHVRAGDHPATVLFPDHAPARIAEVLAALAPTYPCVLRPEGALLVLGIAHATERDTEFLDAAAALSAALPLAPDATRRNYAARERTRHAAP